MRTPDLHRPQPRGLVFGWVLMLLAAIDIAAVVILREGPIESPAAVAARGVVCACGGFVASRRPADGVVVPLLVALAATLSLAVSDVAVLFAGPGAARGRFANPVIAYLVVPAACAAVGAMVALAVRRRGAPPSAGA